MDKNIRFFPKILVLSVLIFLTKHALAVTFANIPWAINGSAVVSSGSRVILTNNGTNEHGSMWHPCTLDITQDFDLTFGMNFGVRTCGADGMAFVLQPNGINALGGNSGDHSADMNNSLNIGFDTFTNTVAPYNDPPYDSLNIATGTNVQNAGPSSCGGTGIVSGPTGCGRPPIISYSQLNAKDGLDHTVEFIWTASTRTIQVKVDGNVNATWVLPSNYLSTIFNNVSQLNFGITAATGGEYNFQEAGLISGTVNGGSKDATTNYCSGSNTPVNTVGPTTIPTNECGTPTNIPTFTISPTQTIYQSPTSTPTPYPPTCGTPTIVQLGGQNGQNLFISTCSNPTNNATINVPPGPQELLIVQIATTNTFPSMPITYAGVSMTLLTQTSDAYGSGSLYTYYLYGPATGSNTLNIGIGNGNCSWNVAAILVQGVNSTTPIGAYHGSTGSGNTWTDNLAPIHNGSLVIDFVDVANGCGNVSATSGQSGTTFPVQSGGPEIYGTYVQAAGAGNYPISYSTGSCGPQAWGSQWFEIQAPPSCTTPTFTILPTSTNTPSPSPSATRSVTLTDSPTNTPSATPSDSPTYTVTLTVSPSSTPSVTFSPSPTKSNTPSATPSFTPSDTPTASPTDTPSFTATPSFTQTSSSTVTPTDTPSATPSSTSTVTSTYTNTPYNSPTPTFTSTPTDTISLTATPSSTPSDTFTQTSTATQTNTFSPTPSSSSTPTVSDTSTATPTFTPSNTFSSTSTATPSFTPTASFSPSPSYTDSPTPSFSFTNTATPSFTPTNTPTFTNTATKTITNTFTYSPTVTPTLVPMPNFIQITIYNSAGELVRRLYSGSSQFVPTQLQLNSSSMAEGTGNALQISFVGFVNGTATSVGWDGRNDGGQYVEAGTYEIKLEAKDSFGRVTSLQQNVQVVAPGGSQSLELFNSAGEKVAEIPLPALPAGVSIASFSLNSSSLAPSYNASSGQAQNLYSLVLTDSKGNTHPAVWDARNQQGQPLQPGTYTLQLLDPSGSLLLSHSLCVLADGSQAGEASFSLAPNPLINAQTVTVFYHPGPQGSQVVISVYNLAGQLVAQGSDNSNSGKWALGVSKLAPGIYMVALDRQQGSGLLARSIQKLSVIK